MQDNSVGVYNYRIGFKRARGASLGASDLPGKPFKDFLLDYLESRPEPAESANSPRRWYVDKILEKDDGASGIIQYGRTGFGSRLVDGKTRQQMYERAASDIEIIPIYHRFWVPKYGLYSVWSIQAFGGYSCNTLVVNDFRNAFKSTYPGFICVPYPIYPAELGIFQNAEVKAVTLRKKRASRDAADDQVGGESEEVNLSVQISAPDRKSNLGKLKDLLPRYLTQSGRGMTFGGAKYDAASAKVTIDGETKTIPLVGALQRTCIVDISDTVDREDGHPTLKSMEERVETLIQEISVGLG